MLGLLFIGNGILHVKHTGLTVGGLFAIIYLMLSFFCVVMINLLMVQGIECPFDHTGLASNTWVLSAGFFLSFIIGTIIGMISAYIFNTFHPGRS